MTPPRLALLCDGTAVGFFAHQHETHVVVIEPNGHSYTFVGPCGRPSRHLTPTLLSAHRELVVQIFRFRNRYCWCASARATLLPYMHSVLGDASSYTSRQQNSSGGRTVCWPKVESWSATALWNHRGNVYEIESVDGAARVQLHASGKIAHVRYLIQLKNDTGFDIRAARAEYTWIEQTFPAVAPPSCFEYPVRLLARARIARGSGIDGFSVNNHRSESLTDELPRNGAAGGRPTFRPLDDQSPDRLDARAFATPNAVSVDAISRWIKGMSRSLDRLVVVERAEGLDLIVSPHDSHSTVLMINETHPTRASGWSLVECDRSFFRAFDTQGCVAQQFTSQTIPLELDALNRDFDRRVGS